MFDLYEKIDAMCKEKGLTIAKMCKIAGLRSSVLYDLKSGKKKGLHFTTIQKIAMVLDVSTDEFQEEEHQKSFLDKTSSIFDVSDSSEAKKEPPIMDSSNEKLDKIFKMIDELPPEAYDKLEEYVDLLNIKYN